MLDVVLQIVDFLFKAVTTYAQTAEGQKEFMDIYNAVALEWQAANPGKPIPGADLLGDQSHVVDRPRPTPAGKPGQPTKESIRGK